MNKLELFTKRLFDIVFAIVGIVLLLLPWLIIAIVILFQKRFGGGFPIIYSSERVG